MTANLDPDGAASLMEAIKRYEERARERRERARRRAEAVLAKAIREAHMKTLWGQPEPERNRNGHKTPWAIFYCPGPHFIPPEWIKERGKLHCCPWCGHILRPKQEQEQARGR